MIEQKGMTFDHDFGYFSPLLFSLLAKEGRRKGEWISKSYQSKDQRSCLSARSTLIFPYRFGPYLNHRQFRSYIILGKNCVFMILAYIQIFIKIGPLANVLEGFWHESGII